jgi:hypothetical protein
MNHIYCDFETTTDNVDDTNTRVWLWGAAKSHYDYKLGVDIASFFSYVNELDDTSVLYFHNGSRFDFEFIKHYIGEHYEFVDEPKDLINNTAWVMAKDRSTTYSIRYRNSKWKFIYFKCSFLFLNTALSQLPGASKIEHDDDWYRKPRNYKSIDDVEPDEIEYMLEDLRSMITPMQEYAKLNKLGIRSYTSSGVAAKKFRKTIKDFKHRYKGIITLSMYDKLIPYATGALCMINPKYEGKLVHNIKTYDANSLYPFSMRDTPMPYGKPIWGCGATCEHVTSLLMLRVSCKLKPGYIPCLTNSGGKRNGETIEWKKEFNGEVIYITSLMLEEVMNYYNFSSVDILEKICFNHTMGIGVDFIDEKMHIKETAPKDSMERFNAKLDLNCNYGRFMMSPYRKSWKMVKVKYNEKLRKDDMVYGKYRMVSYDDKSDEVEYTPLGIFILSNARQYIIKNIQANRDRFVYCDTDSIAICDSDKGDFVGPIHNTKLGAFKQDDKGFKMGIYIQRKLYFKADSYDDGIKEMKCGSAGIDRALTDKMNPIPFTFGNIIAGKIIPYVKAKKRLKGGIVLQTKEKHIAKWEQLKGGDN